MFYQNDVIKVLIPNVINNGYDYRAIEPCDVGDFVTVTVAKKVFTGIVIGPGDGNIAPEKIKPIITHHYPAPAAHPFASEGESPIAPKQSKGRLSLPKTTIEWIKKMSDWTMMPMGSVLKLILGPSDFNKKSKPKIQSYFDTKNVSLTAEQRDAADQIELDHFNVHLLDGITGSGKTQVYFDSVMRVYDKGKQILILMPEIALTAQFIGRFKERFGDDPFIWHSNLTPQKRRDIWHSVLTGDVKIIVGTRSALFLPWQNLRLIIVDEEHDGSYKQEDMGLYHARDMAVLLAKISDFPVVLSSATPSFETLKNVLTGKYKISKLNSRFGGAMLPKIEIVDMRKKKC